MLLRADAKADLVRGLPLFANLSRGDLRHVARIAVEQRIAAGTQLITEGEPGRSFYVVAEGEVEVLRRRRPVRRLGPGSFLGEIALLSQGPRTATVVAVTDLRVLAIAQQDFLDLLDEVPTLWLKIARELADRLDADEAQTAG